MQQIRKFSGFFVFPFAAETRLQRVACLLVLVHRHELHAIVRRHQRRAGFEHIEQPCARRCQPPAAMAMFRWIEDRMPSQLYAHHHIRFDRDRVMPEGELRALLAEHGFTIANMSYRVVDNGQFFEYRMVIRTTDQRNTARLARDLCELAHVREFRISPTGD